MNRLNELREHARRAGDKLVEDLRFAEVTTGGWSNSERSDDEVARIMNACLDDLAATDCWGEENRTPSNALWKVAGEVLSVGWLQNHARQKPRGYAGDFEMLQKIVDQEVCNDRLGRAFDHFFQAEAAPEAVRLRTQSVADRIVQLVRESTKNEVRVCSIGSGPAIDIQLACQELSESERNKLGVALLDLDPEAITHASERLAPFLRDEQLNASRENLFRLPRLKRAASLLDQVDFIACTGLFDYLTDEDAAAMLQWFNGGLRNGGEMLVFNFAPSNPSRAYMEWIGNWYLTYRDEDDLSRLVRDSLGDGASAAIDRADSDACVFLSYTKS